jgi:hypothetical protein
MACSHSTSCPLFAQFQLNTTLRSWKIMYCDSDTRSRNCHRFKLSESGHAVPLNLLPNGTMLDIDAGASAGQCGPATVPATPAPSVGQPVRAPAPEPALAVAERAVPDRVAATPKPTPAAPAPAAAAAVSPHLQPAAARQRITPTSVPPAMSPAPAANARARSLLDRILGRKA